MKGLSYPMTVEDLNRQLQIPGNALIASILWLAQQIEADCEPNECDGCPMDN